MSQLSPLSVLSSEIIVIQISNARTYFHEQCVSLISNYWGLCASNFILDDLKTVEEVYHTNSLQQKDRQTAHIMTPTTPYIVWRV